MRARVIHRIGFFVTTSVFAAALVFFLAANMAAAEISIIPKPVTMTAGTGTFTLTANTPILVETGKADVADTGNYLAGVVAKGTGMKLAVKDSDSATAVPGSILLTTKNADASLGDEGYSLEATDQGVTIRAPKAAGLFYGVQTLFQLLPPGIYSLTPVSGVQWTVPAVKITDQPRFKWRGFMLDVARHFEPKADVLHYLDVMANHKLNVMHFHLDDDQGWRIEIKKYPKLTSVGAWRPSIDFGFAHDQSTMYGPDGQYGGFFTQDDAREIVAYAAKLHITVVPEIEMPGHSGAAVRSYPEYGVGAGGAAGGAAAGGGRGGGRAGAGGGRGGGGGGRGAGVFCAGNPDTYTFLSGVLNEVMDMFPSQYIHVGGDEVNVSAYNDAKDQQLITDQHLSGVDQVEPYFMNQIQKIVEARGRTMIGWDEVFIPNQQTPKPAITMNPRVAIMAWRSVAVGGQAATQDHDVVMSPTEFAYLDYKQANGATEQYFGATNYLPLEKVYSFDPVGGLNAQQSSHIMGVQGNLWTEHVPNIMQAQYMTWPREAALAEIGWSPAAKNYDDFTKRMSADEPRLDAAGVNYRPVEDETLHNVIKLSATDPTKIEIDPGIPGAEIYYTMDHTFPTRQSKKYDGPFTAPKGWADITLGIFRPNAKATIVYMAGLLDGRQNDFTSTLERDAAGGDAHPADLFWTSGSPTAADNITITFDTPQVLHSATVHTGGGTGYTGTELQNGVLEVSADGKTFTTAGTFANGTVQADLGGKTIAAIRIQFTKTQSARLIVKDITLN